jgi:lysophospholipase L1-like esterase
MKKLTLSFCLAALLATPAMAQVDMSRYVALGDSLTAGVASGSLMDYYQNRSYPALLALSGGTSPFEGPYIAPPGFEPALVLNSISPLSIGPTDMPPPFDPSNPDTFFDYFYNVTLEAAYQNLGIPGADTNDLYTKTGNVFNLVAGNFDNAIYDLILRTPEQNGVPYTAQVAAIGQQPTFLTVWIGSNDILGAVIAATPIEGLTMTPVLQFSEDYATLVGGLAQMLPDTEIVVMSIFGDARWVPFATAVPTTTEVPGVGTVPFVGEDGPLMPGDFLTLPAGAMLAQGMGLPVPGSPPLPENVNPATGEPGVILRAAEIDVINERIENFNTVIAGVASQFSNVHLFDVNPFFADLVNGDYRSFGGIELSAEFLVGGVFSYDGIHPQNIGQAILAVELINFINGQLNADLPQVDMQRVLFEGDWEGSTGLKCWGCDPKEATMTREAFLQIYQLFVPEMADRWRNQAVRHADRVVAD